MIKCVITEHVGTIANAYVYLSLQLPDDFLSGATYSIIVKIHFVPFPEYSALIYNAVSMYMYSLLLEGGLDSL